MKTKSVVELRVISLHSCSIRDNEVGFGLGIEFSVLLEMFVPAKSLVYHIP